MKKNYEKPDLSEVKVEIEDVVAASFGSKPGDYVIRWPFETKYDMDKR